MNPCVLAASDQLEISQPIIERILIAMMDQPPSRDRPIRRFPCEARAIAPLPIIALDLGVAILDATGTDQLGEGMWMRAAPPSNIEAIRLILMAFAVLAPALHIMRHSG